MTLTASTDHETALAGGFDIVRPGYWVRPDNAEVRRDFQYPDPRRVTTSGAPHFLTGIQPGRDRGYFARRADGDGAAFYTMREAVEWIGPVDHDCTCPDCMERAEERYAYARDNWYS